jgi:hypothetical protein
MPRLPIPYEPFILLKNLETVNITLNECYVGMVIQTGPPAPASTGWDICTALLALTVLLDPTGMSLGH